MDRDLKPDKLEILPSDPSAPRVFRQWLSIFKRYKAVIESKSEGASDGDYLALLSNTLSPEVYEIITSKTTYASALIALESTYIKAPNLVVARHKLGVRKQGSGESVDEFLRALHALAPDCGFTAVTAEKHRDERIRDALIDGLSSSHIRTRLLEDPSLTLETAVEKARALELAAQDASAYNYNPPPTSELNAVSLKSWECIWCGSKAKHPRNRCPASEAKCFSCDSRGHFSKMCKSNKFGKKTGMSAAISSGQNPATVKVSMEGREYEALADSGSTQNFVSEAVVNEAKLNRFPYSGIVNMAMLSMTTRIKEVVYVDLIVNNFKYHGVEMFIVPNLCSHIILGETLLKNHSELRIKYGGALPPLVISALAALTIKPPSLFPHLSSDVRPIAIPSRRYSGPDQAFIKDEISRLLKEGIIEPSNSPWRAQVVVVKARKKMLVIDYSSTINKFTYLDAYPLPNLEDTVNKIANYSIYSCLDMKSAYHQVPLLPEDKHYTAFQANGSLYQFRRLCFGLTNAVAVFQRVINTIILDNDLKGVFAYLDDVIVGGVDQADHDRNLEAFLAVVRRYKITLK